MIGYLWAAALGLLATALSAMASQEIRDRLEHIPHAILRLAARHLTPRQHTTIYQDEWLADLTDILKGTEARPITRLIIGTQYALGILISASCIARQLHRLAPHPGLHVAKSQAASAKLTRTERKVARRLVIAITESLIDEENPGH